MSFDDRAETTGTRSADAANVTRRSVIRAAGTASTIPFLAGASNTVSGADDESWMVVAIPDTQYFANNERRYQFAVDQTDWIAENADAENIAFVSHEGDVVHEGDETLQWDRMDAAMATLDGVVPYSTLPGNHDYADTWDRSSGLDNYVDYFGASRYDEYDWFGGTGPGDEEANSYQLFSAGGYDFLHLALEWEPRDATLEWAQGVLDQYPERPTVLTTHAYLTDGDKSEELSTDSNPGRTRFTQEANGDGNSGEQVWKTLVEPNAQVFMVLNGHFHENLNQDADPQTSGEYHQVSENDAGEPVYEMLANYQSRDGTGLGRLRLIRFLPDHEDGAPDRIRVRTYVSHEDDYETDANSEFAFDLDFDERFAQVSSTDPAEEVSFRQGTDGYEGTSDTNLREANPETEYGSAPTVTVDAKEPHDSDNSAQALVRFDGIIGDGDGQVPPNATVNSATLTVETVEKGSGGSVHRLLRDWDESDTWASLDDGISADGSDATTDPEAETGAVSVGPTAIDVTAGVQAWADGEVNYGWAILPLGDDGWDFSTAEGETPPRLTVTFESGDGDGGNGDDESPLADYANEEGIIEMEGVQAAVDDWQAGDIDMELLQRVINAWRSGKEVN